MPQLRWVPAVRGADNQAVRGGARAEEQHPLLPGGDHVRLAVWQGAAVLPTQVSARLSQGGVIGRPFIMKSQMLFPSP